MFLRLLLLSALTFYNLFACSGGYSSCVQKVRDAHALQNNTLFIPINSKYRLVQSTSKPHADIVKHDPFLGLFLVKDENPFAYPFIINTKIKSPLAMVDDTKSCAATIVQKQVGLNTFAKLRQPLITPSILTTSCCSLAGIVTEKGAIEEPYLTHFLASKEGKYADMGVRLKQHKKRVVVSAKDPFFANNPLKKGDLIVAMDGKKVYSAALLMQRILFAKVGSKHTVIYERGQKKQKASITLQKRYGGGYVSDTFLEKKGLFFDENLHLTKIGGAFRGYGLKVGDRLIQVNKKAVKSQKELRNYIEKHHNIASLLFERNGFEFFVNIK